MKENYQSMERNPPTISVIMPVYNGAQFLREAIVSVINQSFTDFEFIIINDGSTDDSARIIREYEQQESRIKFINQSKNSGLIEVLNLGLSLAKGKYIARMDADDISLPNRFEIQYKFLVTHVEIGVVGSNVHFIDSSGRRTSNFVNNPRLPQTPNQINWSLCFSCCLMHPTIMARRELLIDAGGYNKLAKHAEDYDLWVRMSATTKFYNLPQKLLLLRRHKTNITVVHIDTTLANSRRISQNHLSHFLDYEISYDLLAVFWKHGSIDKELTPRIIKIYEDLLNVFRFNFLLNSEETRFIKKDIVRRIVELLFQGNTRFQDYKALLIYAGRLNLAEVCKNYFKIKIRILWKRVKQLL